MKNINELIEEINNSNDTITYKDDYKDGDVTVSLSQFDTLRKELEYLRNAKNSIIDAIQKGDGVTVRYLKTIGFREYVYISNDKIVLELNDVITKLRKEVIELQFKERKESDPRNDPNYINIVKVVDSLNETITELRNENRLLKDRESKGFWNWFK